MKYISSELVAAFLGAGLVIAFFGEHTVIGMVIAFGLLFYVLRHAPASWLDEGTKKDTTSSSDRVVD